MLNRFPFDVLARTGLLVGFVLHFSGATSNVCAEEQEQICRFCRQANAAAASGERGPRRYAPDRQVDVLHIKLDVTPDFESRTIAGTTTVRFAPIARALTELRLDAVNLAVTAVRGSEKIASFINSREDLTIVFERPIPVGQEAWVEVDHSAQPTKGFYFRTPEMGYPESDTHVWTQGETHEARHWFPCFDYPNERSSTEVLCHVPREMTVLSNGELISESVDEESGLKSVHWLQEKPHANYLICLVAGFFEKLEDRHGDVPLAFFTQPSLASHAANSFADTAQIMKFFEQEIGIPFPWNKYYQVTIRDFNSGGMENTSLTTLTHYTIFAKETENIRSTRSLDAHEMAHQWFGDLVTCKDWSHLWLNEGFATYYQALYEGHKFGKDALLYDMYRKARGVLRQGARDSRPIVYKAYSSPGEQFDYRAYPKGAWVLHMLRSQLGVDQYRKCIQSYLERHALTSVVTEELNAVIEEISGRSFDPFFDQWVYHARHPDLDVEHRWLASDKMAKVTVRQTQEVSDDVLRFQFPTKLRFLLEDGTTVDHDVTIDGEYHEFFVTLPSKPLIVRFDPEYSVLADVTFKKPDAMLFRQLKNESDVIGRLLAIDGLKKRKTNRSIKALQHALQNDSFFGVRKSAASALEAIGNDAAFAALIDSQEQSDARVRLAVIEAIAEFYRPEAMEALKKAVNTESNPAIASEALKGLGKYHDKEVAKLIRRSLRSESFRNELASGAVSCIRSQADDAYVDELVDVLRERQQEFTTRGMGRALETLATISRDLEDKSVAREFLHAIVAEPNSPLRRSAVRALGKLADPKSVAILESLASDDRNDRMGRAAQRAVESIESDRQFVPDEVDEMRTKLRELKRSQESLKEELERIRSMYEARLEPDVEDPVPAAANP